VGSGGHHVASQELKRPKLQTNFTTRPGLHARDSHLIILNKENKFQNLLAAVELNRTAN
jgi:hypothetical protein